ncbi:MAG TPA: TetR/AcrR family transcriptional regulator [Gaiellaceae bacterium]
MARIAADRETHLTPAEIAREALRQFDEGGKEPSIRSLAAELRVAPTAVYYHFPSQAAIYQAVVELVWGEATRYLLELVPNPLEADPIEVLVASGIATRRAWVEHYAVAPYMAATPEANEFMSNALGLMANLFERLGLEGEEAAKAFHFYGSFMIGATLFAASRKESNARLDARDEAPQVHRPYMRVRPRRRKGLTIDDIADLSAVDPQRDEELFAEELRRLVEGFSRRV